MRSSITLKPEARVTRIGWLTRDVVCECGSDKFIVSYLVGPDTSADQISDRTRYLVLCSECENPLMAYVDKASYEA